MAMSPENARTPRGTDRAMRLKIAAQVALAAGLSLVAVILVTYLAERPGLRLRFDLTREQDNTLDPASSTVIDQLPGDVDIDVFFTAPEPPFDELGLEVQERARKLLVLLRDSGRGKVHLEYHDLSDRRGTATQAESRMHELDLREIEPGGVIVVSMGSRRAVLRLRGDLADLDPGNPGLRGQPYVAPRLVGFHAEETLISAMLKVAQTRAPKVVFTTGHGERDLERTDPGGLARLERELEGDGFKIVRWDIEKQGSLPADCTVLAIVGPEQPFTAGELVKIQEFMESGGRLIAAPGSTDSAGPESLAALLERYGVHPVMNGLIARPIAQPDGRELTGVPQCAEIIVWKDGMAAQNPVTTPLWRAGRRISLPFTRSLKRGNAPPGCIVLDLLRSGDDAWRDVADARDPQRFDWSRDPGEDTGPFVLAMQAKFPPSKPVPEARATGPGSRPESSVLCVGSSAAFANELVDTNRDFLLNLFNAAAAREYRVNVSKKSPITRRLDVSSGNALSIVNFAAVIVLPGISLLLGLWTAWKRRH